MHQGSDQEQCQPWTRREVLQAGTAGLAGLALGMPGAADAAVTSRMGRVKNCIFIMGVGGMPQLDTWDPKPDAPAEVRGPFRPIETSVPGTRISELLPRLAKQAHRYALVRSVYHTAAPIHETGLEWMQTGNLSVGGTEWPHFGAVTAHLGGGKGSVPAHVVLPHPILDTGVPLRRGQDAGFLGREFDPFLAVGDPAAAGYSLSALLDLPLPTSDRASARDRSALRSQLRQALHAPELVSVSSGAGVAAALRATAGTTDAFAVEKEKPAARDRYGRNTFGQSCLLARRLVEHGTRFVTINQFDTLFHSHTWDCHGYQDLPTRVQDLGDQVAPEFDRAVAALIQDLVDRGLYEDTLVCCFTEFGRSPRINAHGGRDHHTGCWSVMLGGGGVRGGVVVGASDAEGAQPTQRPVDPGMLAATVYRALGVPLDTLLPGPEGHPVRLLPFGTEPLHELL